MSATSVSVVGAGLMGSAIATRLLEQGCAVGVFDLDPVKVAALVDKGAFAVASPSAAAQASSFVILSLNHADIVRAVVFGDNGVAAGAAADKILIDMSSIDPKDTAAMAARLRDGRGAQQR